MSTFFIFNCRTYHETPQPSQRNLQRRSLQQRFTQERSLRHQSRQTMIIKATGIHSELKVYGNGNLTLSRLLNVRWQIRNGSWPFSISTLRKAIRYSAVFLSGYSIYACTFATVLSSIALTFAFRQDTSSLFGETSPL